VTGSGEGPEELRARVRALLAERQGELDRRRREREEAMTVRARRLAEVESVASRLFAEVIEPRLALLAEELPSARYVPAAARRVAGAAEAGTVELNLDRHLSAEVSLAAGIALEEPSLRIFVRPEVTPLAPEAPAADSLSLPADAADARRVAAFLDERVLAFVAAYLRLDDTPALRRGNLVTDPVCGAAVDRFRAAATALHEGRTYHFCAEACRERFLAAPERYGTPTPLLRRLPRAAPPPREGGPAPPP
jgi:YHS domain-containing protein